MGLDYNLFYSPNVEYLYGAELHNRRSGRISNFKDLKLFEFTNESGCFIAGEKTFEMTIIFNGSYDKNLFFRNIYGFASRPEMGIINYEIRNYNSGGSYSVVETWTMECKCVGVTDISAEENGVYACTMKFYSPKFLWRKYLKELSAQVLGNAVSFKDSTMTGWVDHYQISDYANLAFSWEVEDITNQAYFRIYQTGWTPDALATPQTHLGLIKPTSYASIDVTIDYTKKTVSDYRAIGLDSNPFVEVPMGLWTIDGPNTGAYAGIQAFSSAKIKIYELRGMPPWK